VILYCHCKYARVIPPEVKARVLEQLAASDLAFHAVPDLCEMSARKDPALAQVGPAATIIACFPRAVRGLFQSAGHALPAEARVLNMRVSSAEEILHSILPAGGGS
jgi:hypothetical protein